MRVVASIVGLGVALGVAQVVAPAAALAQKGEARLDRGPTAELYIRKRPRAPEAPPLSPELQRLLADAEAQRDAKRTEAIGLLREFLAGDPEGDTRAEGLFKLAELLWEDSRRIYLETADRYERQVEACRHKRCRRPPVEPRLDLGESERLYRQLIADYPQFRRADLVLYLIGFAAKQDGREPDALEMFQRVIADHPTSPLFGDAWMMIGEHHFAAEDWVKARAAYTQILDRPKAAVYDLALFKTAWCDWKLGDVDAATDKLKRLIGQFADAPDDCRGGGRHRCSLRDEALDYLVIIFTEDRSITPEEIHAFLASVGGDRYSRETLLKVAQAYAEQSEHGRAAATYRFLIDADPGALGAAAWQRRIVDTWVSALDGVAVRRELKVLVEGYGPTSAWTRHQKGGADALARSLAATEELARTIAMTMHAEAQRQEERDRTPSLALFEAAADAYSIYLAGFGGEQDKTLASEHAAELRYYRADILYWKMQDKERAGDEYLAVGKSAPIGDWHQKALRQAIRAFEEARPKDTAGRKQMYEVDKKFGEALDLYVTLFKDDPELVGLIFKNGQRFYDYGDYDEAIKRFGLIVTEFPDDPNALAAGDRILKALASAKDYENIETWARRLKQAKAFAAKDEQARLDRYIVAAIAKSGDTYAEAGKYDRAAAFYLRIPKEFPKHADAATMMMNAGVMYEKARKPEQAAEIYLELAERYGAAAIAADAAFAAGRLYEQVAYFDRAAEAYELHVARFPKSRDGADALYFAGVLRQALGQHDRAIAHFQLYAKRYRDRKDAAEVSFRIGAVHEDAGDDGRADQAFRAFARAHKGHRRVIEAHVRAGRASIRLGQVKRAADELDAAVKLHKKASATERSAMTAWIAEARYWQGELAYREYEKVSLAVKLSALDKTIEKKMDLLLKAQEIYLSVLDHKHLRWSTNALFRVGNTFELFADALRSAPVPTGMSAGDRQAYQDGLDAAVVDAEDKAIELYSAGYRKSIELQVYDLYTSKIRDALGRLAPDEFPPEREARAGVRGGDRPLDIELVREVAR
jgi:cellulose synthase operon protein C